MSPAPLPCTNVKVRQLMRRIGQHYDAEVAACGIKTTQYSLLANAAKAGPIKSVDLARRLKMTPSTLSRNLRPLIAAGYVSLEHGGDARSHLVVVSASGQAKIAEAMQLWRSAHHSLQVRLGAERLRQLHTLIDDALVLLDDTPVKSR